MAERLSVCHECKMIGSEIKGEAHRIARGHNVEILSSEKSDAIREIWAKESADRATAFTQLAKAHVPHPASAPAPDTEGER